MRTSLIFNPLFLCTLVLALGTGVNAQTTVIYEDDFTRQEREQPGGFTQVLKTSTPYNVASNGAWWRAFWSSSSNSMNVSGERGGMLISYDGQEPQQRAAFLDFEPRADRVYRLSVEMSVAHVSAGDGFLAMGFSSNSAAGEPYETAKAAWEAGGGVSYIGGEYTQELDSAVFGWLFDREGSAEAFQGSSLVVLTRITEPVTRGLNRFELKLDTTGRTWTGEYLLNGQSVERVEFRQRPDINSVFLSVKHLANGKFDNFSLTVTRP